MSDTNFRKKVGTDHLPHLPKSSHAATDQPVACIEIDIVEKRRYDMIVSAATDGSFGSRVDALIEDALHDGARLTKISINIPDEIWDKMKIYYDKLNT